MKKLRHFFTRESSLKYLGWRALRVRVPSWFQLRTGPRILLRPFPSTDADVAYQVFVTNEYQFPFTMESDSIRRIIDVGGNVGYTVILWGQRFPRAEIIVFEPHPEHISLIREHVYMNNMTNRVTLYPEAAGTTDGELLLTDDGSCSRLVLEENTNTIRVPVVDWYEKLGAGQIDLLKIDIEGSEYDLLNDNRFGELSIRYLILEWHEIPGNSHSSMILTTRLQNLGYKVICSAPLPAPNGMTVGIIFGEYAESIDN